MRLVEAGDPRLGRVGRYLIFPAFDVAQHRSLAKLNPALRELRLGFPYKRCALGAIAPGFSPPLLHLVRQVADLGFSFPCLVKQTRPVKLRDRIALVYARSVRCKSSQSDSALLGRYLGYAD